MIILNYRVTVKMAVLVVAVTGLLYAFSEPGPPPGVTGGFGEPTCFRCHSTNPTMSGVDEGRDPSIGGDFYIDLGDAFGGYVPGETYEINVVIAQPGQSRWGFELSARDEDGNQAGAFQLIDERITAITPFDKILYVHHTGPGTMAGQVDGPVSWSFYWIAPDDDVGPVFFNAAGNAADNDGSADGDYIYTDEEVILPAVAAP